MLNWEEAGTYSLTGWFFFLLLLLEVTAVLRSAEEQGRHSSGTAAGIWALQRPGEELRTPGKTGTSPGFVWRQQGETEEKQGGKWKDDPR